MPSRWQQGHNDAVRVLQIRIASLETEVKQWEKDSAGVPIMKERLRQCEQECADLVKNC
jgi:type III secretory pathway component EscU